MKKDTPTAFQVIHLPSQSIGQLPVNQTQTHNKVYCVGKSILLKKLK